MFWCTIGLNVTDVLLLQLLTTMAFLRLVLSLLFSSCVAPCRSNTSSGRPEGDPGFCGGRYRYRYRHSACRVSVGEDIDIDIGTIHVGSWWYRTGNLVIHSTVTPLVIVCDLTTSFLTVMSHLSIG